MLSNLGNHQKTYEWNIILQFMKYYYAQFIGEELEV